MGYKSYATKYQGWGLDFSYEKIFLNLLSVKASFEHMPLFDQDRNKIITAGVALYGFVYPLRKNWNGFTWAPDILQAG